MKQYERKTDCTKTKSIKYQGVQQKEKTENFIISNGNIS